MKPFILLLLICSPFITGSLAQEIQWASRVIDFSSEYQESLSYKGRSKRYRATQALGAPNVMAQGGSSPCAWSPATERSDAPEWIHLGFDNPRPISTILVGESQNPGCISKVSIFDAEGEEYEVYSNPNPTPLPKKSNWLKVQFPLTTFLVSSVKVELQTNAVLGWCHLDAIGASQELTVEPPTINLISLKEPLTVSPFPPSVNSEADELFPVFGLHGQRLYFSRKNHPENTNETDLDIWFSDLQAGEWQYPKRLAAPINNENHNYIGYASGNDRKLLLANLYAKDSAQIGISVTHWKNKTWSAPAPFTLASFKNHSPYFEFFLSQNEKIILLAIEKEEGEGGRDLYVSEFLEEGKWSVPLALGNTINTADDEMTPFLAADGRTLYFASLGHMGYGSADLFRSVRKGEGWQDWATPENLGPAVNTPEWESAFTIDPAGEFGCFVSFSASDNGSADIFKMKLPNAMRPTPQVLISGKVLNYKTNEPIFAEMGFEFLPLGESFSNFATERKSGEYAALLPANHRYGYWAKAPGFVSVGDNIDLTAYRSYTEIKKDLYLIPIEVGQLVRLNNVFFEQSRSDLLEESFPELNRLQQTLLDNPTVEVVLEGHTDLAGDPRLNLRLSKQRVAAVKEYLTGKGIAEERIGTKAFGSTKPLSKERTPDARKKNRRVEFRIRKM